MSNRCSVKPLEEYSFTLLQDVGEEVWSCIEGSLESSVFMSREWHQYLAANGQKSVVVQVSKNDDTVGFFIGNRSFGFVIGAPLPGMGTYLGGFCSLYSIPEQERFLLYSQLAQWLFKSCHCLYLTVSDWLFRSEYEDYYPYEDYKFPLLDGNDDGHVACRLRATLTVDTSVSEQELWRKSSYSSFRYCVNKAKKRGLRVRFITQRADIGPFVKTLHQQMKDVASRHKMPPHHYQKERFLQSLCENLFPNRILMIQVIGTEEKEERVMASSIFCVDKNVSSFFAAASFRQYMKDCPNEIMVWEALRELHRRGVHYTVLTGTAPYKRKFGSYYCYIPKLEFYRFGKMNISFRNVYNSFRQKVYGFLAR